MNVSEEICEKPLPQHIVLPICMEAQYDVFFNILKNIIARSKLDDHYIDNALKLGMMADQLSIKSEDLTTNWNELVSNEQQIRQSKMLGYWAIEHFPSLGKKLLGGSWEPPKRKSAHIIENLEEINADEIDAIIFKKLKLRILQINVSKSTLNKLKLFIVDMPTCIAKINECQLSPKIKSFDIYSEWITDCWKALRLGKFSLDVNFKQRVDLNTKLPQLQSLPQREIENHCGFGSESVVGRKRAHLDTRDVNVINDKAVESSNGELSISSESASTRKRAHLDIRKVNKTVESNSGEPSISSQSVSACERVNVDDVNVNNDNTFKCGEPSINSIHAGIIELRKDFSLLNNSFNSDRQSFIEKDKQILILKNNVEELRQANEKLVTDQLILKDQIEKQTSLIHSLQQGVDATTKLYEQSERDSIRKDQELNSIKKANEKLNVELTVLNNYGTASQLKIYIDKLESDLQTVQKINGETSDQNTKLIEELHIIKTYSASKDEQLENVLKTLNELRVQVDLSSPDKVDIQTQTEMEKEQELNAEDLNSVKMANKKLNDELSVLNNYAANMVSELKIQIEKLESDLETVQKINGETSDQNTKLMEELHVSKTYCASKDEQLENVMNTLNELRVQVDLSSPDKVDIQTQTEMEKEQEENAEDLNSVKMENIKLNDELSVLNNYAANMVSELKIQIEKLESDLETVQKINGETSDQNTKLMEELHVSKTYCASKDEQLENVMKTLNELRVQVDLSSPDKLDIQTQTDMMEQEHGVPVVTGKDNIELNDNVEQELDSDEEFWSDDPVVQECRPLLKKLEFGWMKFQPFKTAKYCPGFVHPPDADGICRAQKVMGSGYVSNSKNEYFYFEKALPQNKKKYAEITALREFNRKHKFSFT